MTSKKYRPWDPDQAFLFPPAMRDWLEEDHLVYRLLDVVGSLDIRSIYRRFSLLGVFKARAEWTLVCLCHNLIKLLAAQSDLAAT